MNTNDAERNLVPPICIITMHELVLFFCPSLATGDGRGVRMKPLQASKSWTHIWGHSSQGYGLIGIAGRLSAALKEKKQVFAPLRS